MSKSKIYKSVLKKSLPNVSDKKIQDYLTYEKNLASAIKYYNLYKKHQRLSKQKEENYKQVSEQLKKIPLDKIENEGRVVLDKIRGEMKVLEQELGELEK